MLTKFHPVLNCRFVSLWTIGLLFQNFASGAQTFEMEDYQIGRQSSGTSTTTMINARASAGEWVFWRGENVGDWLQFTLPDLLPGRYELELRYRIDEHMGKARIEWGEAAGEDFRQVNREFDFNEFPEGERVEIVDTRRHRRKGFDVEVMGTVGIDRPGYKTLRFTLLDRKGGQLGLGVDSVRLVPASSREMQAPAILSIKNTGVVHVDLVWKDRSEGESGFLIERLGYPYNEWTSVGYAPANATHFISAGLWPSKVYQHRVRAYSSEGLSEPSNVVSCATLTARSKPHGRVIEDKGQRVGEGSFITLKDGRIFGLLNYQDQTNDFSAFTIGEIESHDGGNTWSDVEPYLSDRSGQIGFMMPSLMRLKDGSIGFSYAIRDQSNLVAHRVYCTSNDEGKTWSKPVRITHDLPIEVDGHVFTGATGPHDRLVQLSDGTLIVPMHFTTGNGDEDMNPYNDRSHHLLVLSTAVYKSDDQGKTWRRVFGPKFMKGTSQRLPYRYPWLDNVLQEASLVEHEPGQLLMMMRNPSGFFYQVRSDDFGEIWGPVHQSPVRSALTPAKLWSVDDKTMAVIFNPLVDFHAGNLGPRRALVSMISRDGGYNWSHHKVLDMADPDLASWQFVYPAFLNDGKHLHAFYFGPRGFDLSYRKLPTDWFIR